MNSSSENRRLPELDSLRGIAALTVVFGHLLHFIPQYPASAWNDVVAWLRITPFFIAFAGHEAVILFFLLSGFVLCLPWLDGRRSAYVPYVVRRLFRIYVPYLVAVFAAFTCALVFYTGALPEFGHWVNRPWSTPVSWEGFSDHLMLLGSFKNAHFNPVIWSLVHELRISLIFPFVVVLLGRVGWRWSVGIALTSSGVAVITTKLLGTSTDYLYTLHYLGFFIFGYLLARHRHEIGQAYTHSPKAARCALWILGITAYGYGHLMRFVALQDWVVAIGAGIFIVLALYDPAWRRVMAWTPARFLGSISYSLYLYHAVILLAFLHLFHGRLPLILAVGAAFFATLLISALSWHLIEKTSIRAGKVLGARIVEVVGGRLTEGQNLPISPRTVNP
jgi:peptidoglycan/LPS O-acetylase OafA/YrhL